MMTTKMTTNIKFNITLLVAFLIIVAVIAVIIYNNYQKKKALEAKMNDEVEKLKTEGTGNTNAGGGKKQTKNNNQKKSGNNKVNNQKKEEVTVETDNHEQKTLLVQQNPELNEIGKTSNQHDTETEVVAETEVVTETQVEHTPENLEENHPDYIGAEIFTIPNKPIRLFAQPTVKSAVVASFSSNQNSMFIGKVEKTFLINGNRWLLIKIAMVTDTMNKGYAKESVVDVRNE